MITTTWIVKIFNDPIIYKVHVFSALDTTGKQWVLNINNMHSYFKMEIYMYNV